jgi:exopolysaccharide biosynthesis protein
MNAATFFVVAFFYVAACDAKTVNASDCMFLKTPSYVVYRCDNDQLWIIETTRPLVAHFATSPVPTLREKAKISPEFSLLFNGGYHDGNYANAKLEGLFVLDGKPLNALKPDDGQLSHVLAIDRDGRIASIRVASNELVSSAQTEPTHIQTGPLITEDGRIAEAFIAASLNGKDAYKRTAIGRTRAGETVIVIAKTPRTLKRLGTYVLQVNQYAKRCLTLLNLDGGPSTAIHSNITSDLSYGADKVTPVGFAIR